MEVCYNVVCQCRSPHSTLHVLHPSGAAVWLHWAAVELERGRCGLQILRLHFAFRPTYGLEAAKNVISTDTLKLKSWVFGLCVYPAQSGVSWPVLGWTLRFTDPKATFCFQAYGLEKDKNVISTDILKLKSWVFRLCVYPAQSGVSWPVLGWALRLTDPKATFCLQAYGLETDKNVISTDILQFKSWVLGLCVHQAQSG